MSSPEDVQQYPETFVIVTTWVGQGFFWCVVGRRQGCYEVCHKAQDRPHSKDILDPRSILLLWKYVLSMEEI